MFAHKKLLGCIVCFIGFAIVARGEIADAAYRDGAFSGITFHTGLTYGYDNETGEFYFIHSAGGQPYEVNSVRIGTWEQFLDGNNFLGQRCPSNLSRGIRESILSDALDQINSHYWDYLLFSCWKRPNSYPQSGDGCFRCDALVEWAYEQNGYNICNDADLYVGTPSFQMAQMPAAVQTDPYGVTMTFPSSLSPTSPTVSTSTNLALTASASDVHSGLSYNQPFDYYYATWNGASWSSWDLLGVGNQMFRCTGTPGTYAFYIIAYDNDANSTTSSVYYLTVKDAYTTNGMTITTLKMKLKFPTDQESYTVAGLFTWSPPTSLAGTTATLSVGDAQTAFTLDSSGHGTNAKGKFKLTYKAGAWFYSAKLSANGWGTLWANYGLTNADVAGETVTVPVVISLDSDVYAETRQLYYKARSGKSGAAK